MSMDEANEDDLSDLPPTFELLEPKPASKFVRLLVVLAYVLSVSMVAILLSIYYLFVWEEHITIKNVTESTVSNEIEILETTLTSNDVYTKMYEDINNVGTNSRNTANVETVFVGGRYLDHTDMSTQIQTSTSVSSFLPSEKKSATSYDRISETVSTTTVYDTVQEFGFGSELTNYSTTTIEEFDSYEATNDSLHNLLATGEFDLFNTNTTVTNGSDLLP